MNIEDVKEMLGKSLTLRVARVDWTNPNSREIELVLDGSVISSVYFDVVQKAEYEG